MPSVVPILFSEAMGWDWAFVIVGFRDCDYSADIALVEDGITENQNLVKQRLNTFEEAGGECIGLMRWTETETQQAVLQVITLNTESWAQSALLKMHAGVVEGLREGGTKVDLITLQ